MTRTSRALGLTVAAALMLSGSGLVAGQARAADRNYTTVLKIFLTEIKACKTPIREGRAFRVRAFLDNTASESSRDAYFRIRVLKNGRATGESVASGYIKGGRSSKVYDLVAPSSKAFELDVLAAGRQYGDLITVATKSLTRC